MKSSVLSCFVFLVTACQAQDIHKEYLSIVEDDDLVCNDSMPLGNGYQINYCEHSVFLANALNQLVCISEFAIVDDVTAAYWLDMNADSELDLILETYYGNGRSSWSGGHGETVHSVYVIDVQNLVILFSWDYYFHFEHWQNEVDWTNEVEPEITGGSGGHSTYYYALNYAEGLIFATLEMNESEGEEEELEGELLPEIQSFQWTGGGFQEVHLIPASEMNQ